MDFMVQGQIYGALAQLGERLHGMQEVVSSTLIGSIVRRLLLNPLVANRIETLRGYGTRGIQTTGYAPLIQSYLMFRSDGFDYIFFRNF
jgi:hypothetical protein